MQPSHPISILDFPELLRLTRIVSEETWSKRVEGKQRGFMPRLRMPVRILVDVEVLNEANIWR